MDKPIVWQKPLKSGSEILVLADSDTVAVALQALKKGQVIDDIEVQENIAKGHKLARKDIAKGDSVVKYAQSIGVASESIVRGSHIHSHNLEFRSTDGQYEFTTDAVPVAIKSTDTFKGYRRANGDCGTRNYVAVISSVNCSATAAHNIADAFDDGFMQQYPNVDGVAAFAHGTGCGLADSGDGFDQLQRVFAGYAAHPNVAAVLLVGLGCEVSQLKGLLESQKMAEGPLLRTLNIQTTGGHKKTVERGCEIVANMLIEANQHERTDCPASALQLALQCGGSDAWSGVTANPALGYAADLLVAQGGAAVLAETPEIYGAEHLLTRRADKPDVGRQLIERIKWWEDYVARNNGSLDNNPSPGNKLGGLTTILEKSLGAVAKGGTTPLTGVYRYAEKVDKPGFAFMDSPGYDPASVTGQIASGCNLVAFTTGRGSTFGSKPAPCLKIATNTDMYKQLSDDMDINAGAILSDGQSIQEVGQQIYDRLLAVASGSATLSEEINMGNNEFVPWQIGATM
jgi:altronate hydrolase